MVNSSVTTPGTHNTTSWYVWYHHSSVTVRPVTTTTAWKPQLRVLVCMVSPQFSYCPSGNDNHWRGNHNSGPWYVWYHHSSVTVRPVTTTTTWKPQLRALVCMVSPQFSYCPSGNDNHWRGNHNSGPWYVWYHHSSVTVRPVTTTTTWKPQLRALVCMVSPQFS